jgi:uncharacterized protein (DUF58 family)
MKTVTALYQRFNEYRGRRIFIVPSRFGLVYVGFLILILLGAINYSNSLGHILCFLLASLGWVTMYHSYRNLAKVELISGYADAVFEGDRVLFHLKLENKAKQDSHQLTLLSKQSKESNLLRRFLGYKHPSTIPVISAQHAHTTHYLLPTDKRGRYSLGNIRLSSQFPLGLFTVWTYFESGISTFVYPKPLDLLPLPEPHSSGSKQQSLLRRGNDDFYALTNYREGDSLKSIAWKALARDNVIRTKQFSGHVGGQLTLSWQDVIHLNEIEKQLSQLCQWILQAEKLGLEYQLVLPNTTLNFGIGEPHRTHCLEALARYE